MPPTRTTRHILREAGLVEPGGDVADEQVELVDWLGELRFTLDEIVETARSTRMAAIAGDRRLVPGDRLSREEAIRVAGSTRISSRQWSSP